jgi:hypothetical protein
MDVDRYLTQEVLDAFHTWDCFDADGHQECKDMIRAVVPPLVARVRADTLREAADYLERTWPPRPASDPAEFAFALRQLADEATAE